MGYSRKQKSYTKTQSTFALNITSMTDMFTILLVFLLQTYASSDFIVEIEKGVTLPVSSSLSNPTRAIKISVGSTDLKIEGKTIALLENSDFKQQDISKKDKDFIEPLFNELNSKKEASSDNTNSDKEDRSVLILADSELNYKTIQKVMYTASQAGFNKIKLATMLGN